MESAEKSDMMMPYAFNGTACWKLGQPTAASGEGKAVSNVEYSNTWEMAHLKAWPWFRRESLSKVG